MQASGSPAGFDRVEIKGSLAAHDAHVVYRSDGTVKAVLTIGRDQLALDVEAAMEKRDESALETLLQ
jgi:hypothetical protein